MGFFGKLSKSKSPRELSAPINICRCKMRTISLPGARLMATPNSDTEALLEVSSRLLALCRDHAGHGCCVLAISSNVCYLFFCLLFNTSVIVCAPSPNMFVTAFVILPLSVWVPLLAQPDKPLCNGQKSSAQALAVFVAAYVKPTLVMPKGNGLKPSPCVHIKCIHRVLVD